MTELFEQKNIGMKSVKDENLGMIGTVKGKPSQTGAKSPRRARNRCPRRVRGSHRVRNRGPRRVRY